MTNKILKFVSQMAMVGLIAFIMTSCEKNELKDLTSQNTIEQSSATTRSTVTGFVQAFNNGAWEPLEGATVSISNCPGASTSTNGSSGTNYSLSVPSACSGAGYPLCMEYTTTALDGLTAVDVYMVRRHVLGLQPFTSAREYLAADVNRDGEITLEDADIIQSVLVFITPAFPNDNYLFVNEDDYQALQTQVDAGVVDPSFLLSLGILGNCVTPALNDRRGIKTGDVFGGLGSNCSVLDDDCDNVSFEYCNDGTLIATFTGVIDYVKVAEAGWQNPQRLCSDPSYNKPVPPCVGTIEIQLDPNQSYSIEINGDAMGCTDYIDFP